MCNPLLIRLLKKCTTEEQVDDVFSRYRKTDYNTRIKYLSTCQGNPRVFFAGVEEKDEQKELKSRYLTMRSMFVTGSWR